MERSNITKYIVITILILFIWRCTTSKSRAPYYVPYGIIDPEVESDNFNTAYIYDSIYKEEYVLELDDFNSGIFMWKSDLIDNSKQELIDSATTIKVNTFSSISDVRKRFKIEKKAMYMDHKKIDDVLIRFAESDDNFATVRFYFQLKEIEYYNNKYKFDSWKSIRFVENNLYSIKFYYPQNIGIYYDSLEFTNGTGTWKDYYFITSLTDTFILKEQGKIKNNYKVGEWKYYNSDGSIKAIKNYKLRDKVDVRFPYCIWNKVEPCHCDEKISPQFIPPRGYENSSNSFTLW